MAYRNVFISSSAKLSVGNNQLIINTEEIFTIPLEDISAILIENNQSNITTALLSQCAENGVLVYLCDQKHIPCGIITGYNTHSRKLKMLKAQLGIKTVLKKNLWRDIIVKKIENQGDVLKLLGVAGWEEIDNIANKVKTNDDENMEAVAAAKYFKYLFGTSFNRSEENHINAALNYGYAIIRGAICRHLVVYGLEPALGIHHQNQLNSFNLADDLIEPFRPIVDLCVVDIGDNFKTNLTIEDKKALYNLLNCDVLFNNQKLPVLYAIEKTIQTLQSTMMENKNNLKLCSILPLQNHSYE